MIIRRTEKEQKRKVKSWVKNSYGSHDKERHLEKKKIVTWWFLFIPVFTYENMLQSQL